MKAFTDLEQSKKLAEILPIETADMWWNFYSVTTDNTTPQIIHIDTPWVGSFNWNNEPDNIPCWSLAALMNILDRGALFKTPQGWACQAYIENKAITSNYYDNPVDACVAMIEKLNELKML